jgi:predicted ATPase
VRDLPTGTVTFLFTDVEGSTRLLRELGDRYARALAEHRRALREAFARHGGVEVDTQGDAFFVAFAKASDALAAAAEGQDALAEGLIRVRMGLHTGEPLVTEEGYVGIDVHRAARIAAAGHGGQILVSRSTSDLVGTNSLRNLGEHRLKDLTASERIYQLGDGDFPVLKSLNQTNLPVQPTALVGRERELEEVLELLHSSRLLTLTGAGGSGKTRLALQAAAEVVDEFPDGVWFISLAAVTDAELVLPMIASTIGAKGDLLDLLRSEHLLLLLDNLEQLLPEVAVKISKLVSVSGVKVLATSRERLGLTAEQEYPVPTLPIDDAVALFTARARQLKPSFEPNDQVLEIALRLDGLPLALELAAARVKVLTPAQILERLRHSLGLLTAGDRDAPERHRTLRATIEWSYELLSEAQQRLLGGLSVFAGSFDLEAAEAVCDADLDNLQALVDKSLLRQTDDGRFFMLETIREYATERVTEKTELAELRRRHARHFLAVAEREGDELGGAQAASYARLDASHDNFRAALSYLGEVGTVDDELRLVLALNTFWDVRGHLTEGRKRVEAALGRKGGQSPALRVKVLAAASDYARIQGDLNQARQFCEESLALAREVGDLPGIGRALHELGELAAAEGDFERASALFEEAVRVGQDGGFSAAGSIGNLGDLALAQGDYGRAIELSERALGLFQKEGRQMGTLVALSNIAQATVRLGHRSEASARIKECLELALEFGYREVIAWCLETTAALVVVDQPETAGRLTGAAEALLEQIGSSFGPAERRMHEETIAAIIGLSGEDAVRQYRDEGAAMALEDVLRLAGDSLH